MSSAAPPLPQQCDVVVIGAGAGGLTAAALLARAGLHCLVFEAESQPGGYLAGFQRRGFTFNTSVEWLNQCGPYGFVAQLFAHLGGTPPECRPLQRIRRFKNDTSDYLLTSDPNQLRDQLIADFPAAAAGIRACFRDAERLGRRVLQLDRQILGGETLGPWARALRAARLLCWALPVLPYLRTPVETGLRRYFGSSGAQQLFASHESLMAVMVSLGWAYAGNVQCCPTGGSQTIARWLCERIASAGSTLHLNQRVEEVLLDAAGAAAGVRLADGRQVAARHVVAACDVATLYRQMLPAGAVPPRLLQAVQQAELYHSYFSIYLGLDCSPAALGFGEEALHLTRSDVSRAEHSGGDPQRSLISVLAPSLRDPSLAPAGKGTLTVHCPARLDDRQQWRTGPGYSRGDDYRALKQEVAQILLDRIEAGFAPGLRRHIEVIEIATPVTYWRYTGNSCGSIMGAKPTARNIRAGVAHMRTPVPGLLIGGHCAEYGGGVPMAVKAGANASLIVLQQRNPAAYAALKAVLQGRAG